MHVIMELMRAMANCTLAQKYVPVPLLLTYTAAQHYFCSCQQLQKTHRGSKRKHRGVLLLSLRLGRLKASCGAMTLSSGDGQHMATKVFYRKHVVK